MHRVSVEAHDDGTAGQREPDLGLAAGDQDVAVAVDFAVELDGLAGAEMDLAVDPGQGCSGGCGTSGACAAHAQKLQVGRPQP